MAFTQFRLEHIISKLEDSDLNILKEMTILKV